MSVRVSFVGQVGNHLFQYALGRLIAERHGLALACDDTRTMPPPLRRLLPAPATSLPDWRAYFPHAPCALPGRVVTTPVEAHEFVPGAHGAPAAWDGQTIDLPRLLDTTGDRCFQLRGFFQRFEYYAAGEARIRAWFASPPGHALIQPEPGDVLVNIRRGRDFVWAGFVLPLSYYDAALASLRRVGRVYVCGTGIDDAVRQRLARHRPTYLDGSAIEQFATIRAFQRIVMSNSTFTWWAAFLSSARELVAPRSGDPRGYAFTGYRTVDLHPRSDRYREIEVPRFTVTRMWISRGPAIEAAARARTGDQDEGGALARWLLERRAPLALPELRARFPTLDLHALETDGVVRSFDTFEEPDVKAARRDRARRAGTSDPRARGALQGPTGA